MSETTYTGTCSCGAVEIAATGSPAAMGFCHCTSCRAWAAAPVNAFTLWKTAAVRVTRGEANLGTYRKTEQSHRQFCRSCGGHVLTRHPPWDLIDVYAAVLPALAFEPKLHVHYGERVLPIRDGLPKMRDLPREMGGSGDTLPE